MSASVLNNLNFTLAPLKPYVIGAFSETGIMKLPVQHVSPSRESQAVVDTGKLKARLLDIVRECVPFEQRARVTCLMSIRLDGGADSLNVEVSEELSSSECTSSSSSSSCNTSFSSSTSSTADTCIGVSSANTSTASSSNSNGIDAVTSSSSNSASSNGICSSSSRRKSHAPQRLLVPESTSAVATSAQEPEVSTPAPAEVSVAVSAAATATAPAATAAAAAATAAAAAAATAAPVAAGDAPCEAEGMQPLDLSPNSPEKQPAAVADKATSAKLQPDTKSPKSERKLAPAGAVAAGRVAKPVSNSSSNGSNKAASSSSSKQQRSGSSVGKSSRSRQRRPKRTFDCNQCGQTFECLADLSKHTFDEHKAYRCSFCGVAFTQRSNLQRHSLKHAGFKPFECRCCGKAYYRKDHLARHIEVTHPGQDPKLGARARVSSAECLQFLHRKRQLEQQQQQELEQHEQQLQGEACLSEFNDDVKLEPSLHEAEEDEEMIDVGESEFGQCGPQ